MKNKEDQTEKLGIDEQDAQTLVGVGGAALKTGFAVGFLSLVAGKEFQEVIAGGGITFATHLSTVLYDSRKEKLKEFLICFATKIATLPTEQQKCIEEKLKTETGSRIFERACLQAAQEVDPEKLDFIAAFLKNSLSSDELQEHHSKWLLKLLDDLDVVQIVILQSFAEQNKDNEEFRELHNSIFGDSEPPEWTRFEYDRHYPSHASGYKPRSEKERTGMDEEEIRYDKARAAFNEKLPEITEQFHLARERHALYRSRFHSLVEKGLLGLKRQVVPGNMDDLAEDLTPLGAALLKIIDVIDFSEWGKAEQVDSAQGVRQSQADIKAYAYEEAKAAQRLLGY